MKYNWNSDSRRQKASFIDSKGDKMQMDTVKANDKAEAVRLIEGQSPGVVDLDYEEGAQDFNELGKLGRKWRVAVMFRGQEAIAVESMRALLRGLNAEKDTFRQRHLYCMFDFAACSPDDLKQAESRASLLGDFIFPGNALLNPYKTWAH